MLKGKPFVKWAGGKRSIIHELIQLSPKIFDTYYEPFVGGGALLFELSPRKAIINDYNKELMNVYSCIKDEEKLVLMCNELNKHETNHSETYYYKIRDLDKDKKKFNQIPDYKRAARTIYLNKACFNGLYRVNSNNEFNVPSGKRSKVNTHSENLGIIHCFLNMNDIQLLSTDFVDAVKTAKQGDFVYFDPPYDSDTSTFNSYTENGFGKEDQIRLAELFKELDSRGCYVMLSNYNTSLIRELYQGYHFHYVEAQRNIGANAKDRGIVEEVIITNYNSDDTTDM